MPIRILGREFHRYKRLGSGAYGTVYEYRDSRGNRVAVKNDSSEVAIYQKLQRIGCQKYFTNYYMSSDGHVIFQLMDMSVEGWIGKYRHKSWYWDEAYKIFAQTLRAIRCLHSKGLIYSDLKPANMLVKVHSDGKVKSAKLGDVGCIGDIRPGYNAKCYTPVYTQYYTGAKAKIDRYALASVLKSFSGVSFRNLNSWRPRIHSSFEKWWMQLTIDLLERFPNMSLDLIIGWVGLHKFFKPKREGSWSGSPATRKVLGDMFVKSGYYPDAGAEYRHAAGEGYIPAQMILGKIYYEGLYNTPKDIAGARKWYEKAARLGDEKAQKMVDRIDGKKSRSEKKTEEKRKPTKRENRLESRRKPKTKILVLGSGPVGLLTALLFAKDKNTQVDIWEKRELDKAFTRINVLLVTPATLKTIKSVSERLFEEFTQKSCKVMPPPLVTRPACFKYRVNRFKAFSMPIGEIQKLLFYEVILCPNIRMSCGKPATIENVRAKCSPITERAVQSEIGRNYYNLIVGAEGANSVARTLIGGEQQKLPVVNHGLVLNVPKIGANRQRLTYQAFMSPRAEHRWRVFRSNKGEESAFYVALNLSKKEAKSVKCARPCTFRDLKPPSLRGTIRSAIHLNYIPVGERALQESKVTLFPIEIWKSSKFASRFGNTPLAIVGDAAEGVHFFSGTGLNKGVEMAAKLAGLWKRERSTFVTSYNREARQIADTAVAASTNVQFKGIEEKKRVCKDMVKGAIKHQYRDMTKRRVPRYSERRDLEEMCLVSN